MFHGNMHKLSVGGTALGDSYWATVTMYWFAEGERERACHHTEALVFHLFTTYHLQSSFGKHDSTLTLEYKIKLINMMTHARVAFPQGSVALGEKASQIPRCLSPVWEGPSSGVIEPLGNMLNARPRGINPPFLAISKLLLFSSFFCFSARLDVS